MTLSVSPTAAGKTRRAAPNEPPQERALRELVRTIGLLERVMHPHFARFGISSSQWAALRALFRAELQRRGGIRVTELSEKLLIRPPSVTAMIDRLERSGLVVRDASRDDLRARQVRLTATGRKLVQQLMGVHAAQMDRALSGLTLGDQQELHRLLERLSGHLEGMLGPASRGAKNGTDSENQP